MLVRLLVVAVILAPLSPACANRVMADEESKRATKPVVAAATTVAPSAALLTPPRNSIDGERTTVTAPARRKHEPQPRRAPVLEPQASPSVALPATEQPPTPVVPVRSGPKASNAAASLWLEGADWLPVGERATLRAVIRANPPYHCNREYPHRVFLSNSVQNLELPTMKATDVEEGDQECAVKVPVIAKEPGAGTVRGEVQFSVCTAERCRMDRREVTFEVVVR